MTTSVVPLPPAPPVSAALVDAAERQQLAETWASPGGFLGWFTHVNHRNIGRRYIITAFAFFVLAGLEALVMRTQLAGPDRTLIDPETYRQLFTMHGVTMLFFFAVPVMEGAGIYLVPLMIGARDMAFPRLNAFGYYVYLFAGVVLYGGLLLGIAPDGGWFNYVPLTLREYSPGINIDLWATMVTFIELAALVAAVELIATIFKMRAPGMSLNRMPLFVWSVLVMAFMILFAMPPLMVASIELAIDRTVGGQFFNAAAGGDALLWQHLFWFFGHPEVYIILVPALGMVSQVVETFTRRPVFGYTALVLSLVAIGFASFGLWVHHMFATGLPELGASFFTASSALIAIPSGVQLFCWIASLWEGRPELRSPLLFVLGFLITFVLGGITGVMVASVPFDIQAHDTYFVVAHLHYVLIGGSVFPLLAAAHYWFPKATGRAMDEGTARLSFWLIFAGVHGTFFVQHALGLMGMPRRVHSYPAEMGWGTLNLVSTVGAFVLGTGFAVFGWNAWRSARRGAAAGADPWGASTLEWATASPPENFNFAHVPVVASRQPLWDAPPDGVPVVVGLRSDRREVLITRTLDAAPDCKLVLPGPTAVPLFTTLAVSVSFFGVLFSPWWVPVGGVLTYAMLVVWNWPRQTHETEDSDGPDHHAARREREAGADDRVAAGWAGEQHTAPEPEPPDGARVGAAAGAHLQADAGTGVSGSADARRVP